MLRRAAQPLIIAFALSSIASAALAQDRAQEVLAQARDALGNKAALTGITSLSVGATVRRVMQMAGNMEISSDVQIEFLLPDKYRRTEAVSIGAISRTVIVALSGDQILYDDGGAAAAMGVDPAAPGPRHDETVKSLKQDNFRMLTIWLLAPPSNVPCTFAYAGVAEAPDGKADVVDVKGTEGLNLRLFFDTNSHRLLMATYQTEVVDPEQMKALTQKTMEVAKQGAQNAKQDPQYAQKLVQGMRDEIAKLPRKTTTVQMHFSDHRAIGGVTLPGKVIVETEGQGREDWTISSFKLNTPLKPERFQKK